MKTIKIPQKYSCDDSDWYWTSKIVSYDDLVKEEIIFIKNTIGNNKPCEIMGELFNNPIDAFYALDIFDDCIIVSACDKGTYRVISIFPKRAIIGIGRYFSDLVLHG